MIAFIFSIIAVVLMMVCLQEISEVNDKIDNLQRALKDLQRVSADSFEPSELQVTEVKDGKLYFSK